MSEKENANWGPLSSLDNIRQVTEDVIGFLSYLFADYEPANEDGQRAVFIFAASIQRGTVGDLEIDDAIRETYLSFSGRPHAQWEIEISYEDAERIARVLVASRERLDTQIVGPAYLEMLVRNDTTHSILLPPPDKRVQTEFVTDGVTVTATVGPPSVELLIRCALRREGFERLAIFDGERLQRFLQSEEQRRALADSGEARISALRLLKIMARPELISLRMESKNKIVPEKFEQLATAFRVQMAYEASIVYAPILDVNRLDGTLRQPTMVRQLSARSAEFVQKIGEGEATGHMGDVLLGNPSPVDEELSLRYLRAVAAGDPFSAFMGYYHVLEYQMNEAWFNELREKVEAAGGVLTRPTDDVRRAATEAARLLGVRREDVSYSELKALNAVIKRLDIETFTNDIGNHLTGALDYFKSESLPFVNVQQIDFVAANTDIARAEIAGKLAGRIYAVRCAITHSKESAERYSPYTDDLYLGREIPLVRIAAEQLLISSDDRI